MMKKSRGKVSISCRDFFLVVLVRGLEIEAILISSGENNLVGIPGDGVPAHDYVTVCIYLSAIDFHIDLVFELLRLMPSLNTKRGTLSTP